MKYLLLIISCATLLTHSASAQDHKALIKQTAQLMADAAVKQDYATVISHTYQPFVQAHGGKDSLLATIRNGLLMMKARGITIAIKSAELGDPANEVKVGSRLYSVMPEKLTLTINGVLYSMKSALIGISTDNGKQWYFVDGSSKGDLASILPDVKQLNVPQATQPVKVTN